MLNPIIQKVANLITNDVDPALRRVYEDIVADLEKVREALSQPAKPAPAPVDPPELPLGAPIPSAAPIQPVSAAAVAGDLNSTSAVGSFTNVPPQAAPLPGTGALTAETPAPIPPVGQPVQEFQPQPGVGEAETTLDTPSAPVAAKDLVGGTHDASGLVASLQASHDAAKTDQFPGAAPLV